MREQDGPSATAHNPRNANLCLSVPDRSTDDPTKHGLEMHKQPPNKSVQADYPNMRPGCSDPRIRCYAMGGCVGLHAKLLQLLAVHPPLFSLAASSPSEHQLPRLMTTLDEATD